MNIYLKDGETRPDVALGTSAPSGYTISANPTIDWNKYAEYLINDQQIKAKVIRDELAAELVSITWA